MYASQQDMIDRFGEQELVERTDRVEPYTGSIDSTVLDTALTDASNVVDGYVGARHQLPLASPPELLKQLTCDIARWKLYDDDATEAVTKRYEEAIAQLRDVARGVIVLQVAGTEPPAAPDRAEVDGPDRVFDRDSMRGF